MTFTEALSEAVLLIEPPNHRHVAVMFVDLDHFTRMCTDDPPELVFRLVRKFQQIVSKAVSRCRGRLGSHLGDGAMATFSDLPGRSDCATRTLRCAQAILARIQILSVEHINAGGRAVSISIGLQYGRILSGTINGAKRFGPMIIGDAVNVANRLEQQAHTLNTKMVVGDDLIQRASREARLDGSERAQLVYVGPIAVYGRGTPVDVWVLSNGSMNC